MPEISIPLATVNGSLIGLSVAAGRYQDEFLLFSVKNFFLIVFSKNYYIDASNK